MQPGLATKTKEEWKALAQEIDSAYQVDDSSMPDQTYTAGEYREWATNAGATWTETMGETPLDVLVNQYMS